MQAYLDNSATTRVCPEAVQACVLSMTEGFYNPSAAYGQALYVQKTMETARKTLLRALRAPEDGDLLFTSGGTEADNLAIQGAMKRRGANAALCTQAEHAAVLLTVKSYEAHALLPVDERCAIDLAALAALLDSRSDWGVVSLMQVNNETGAVFPVAQAAKLVRAKSDALVHVDGVQGFLHEVPPDLRDIDLYSISGHKVHAPKGVGALYLSPRAQKQLKPVIWGGGQERQLRSGTENVPGIAAFAAAAAAYAADTDAAARMRRQKLALAQGIAAFCPAACINGPAVEDGAAHILNVSFPDVQAEVFLHALEADGVLVSMGSACAARHGAPSHVLTAMGLPRQRIRGALRLSLSRMTTQEEIDYALERMEKHYRMLKRFQPR